jgi:hypothetical protein
MDVTELHNNDSLKNVFKPSDLRIFYSGPPSEVFIKTNKFAAAMMMWFVSTYICG